MTICFEPVLEAASALKREIFNHTESFRLILPFLRKFLLFALALVGPQHAATAAEKHYLRAVSLTGQYSNLHFVELYDTGEPRLEEEGNMLFSGGSVYWQLQSGLFGEISYQQASDTVDYRGPSQNGRFVESETELFVRDANVLFGRNFGYTAAFLGAGHYFRERNILGVEMVRGLYEELESINGIFGVRGNIFPTRRFQIRVEGRLWTDLDSTFYVASPGVYDPVTFTPGKSFSYRTSIELFFNPVGGLVFSLIPAYEYTQLKKSESHQLFLNGVARDEAFFLPKTEWESYSVTGKLSWYF